MAKNVRADFLSADWTRADHVRALRRRAEMDVSAISPAGLGDWDQVRDLTAAADAEFCQSLAAWEASGSTEDRARVGEAYEGFVESRRYAASQHRLRLACGGHPPVTIIEGDSGGLGFGIRREGPPKWGSMPSSAV